MPGHSSPIGVFDSGVGGLTVLRSLTEAMPAQSFIYLGDTARVPYGSKSPDTVARYSINIAERLIEYGCRALVIACNTASAYALGAVRNAISVPVVGVVEPVSALVARRSKGRVLILGTSGTVRSAAYLRALGRHRSDLEIVQKACPLFVPLAEEGWLHGVVPEQVAATYLSETLEQHRPDSIILGCTHYPLLRQVIAGAVEAAGLDATLYETGPATAGELRAHTDSRRPVPSSRGTVRYLCTDNPDDFVAVGRAFLGDSTITAEHVDIGTSPC